MDAKMLHDYYATQMLRPLPLEDVEKLRIIRDALSLAAAVEGPDAIHSEDMDSTSREVLVMLCRILRRQRDSSIRALKAERERAGKMEHALVISQRAMRAPMDEWKGELERPALDAIAALAAQEGRHD